jgi:hypothetical protein
VRELPACFDFLVEIVMLEGAVRYLAVTDNATGETVMMSPAEAEALTHIDADEIAWAIEEFGVCDSLDHTIIDTRSAEDIAAAG